MKGVLQNIFLSFFMSYILSFVKCGPITANINLGSRVISTSTTYTFTLTLSTAITNSNTILFTFPTGVTLPSIGSITCSGVTGFLKTPTCAVASSSTIRVSFTTGTVNSATFPLYVIQFSGITNPSSAVTLTNFQVATLSGSTVIDSTSSGSVSYTGKTLASSAGSISSAGTQVGIYTSMTFSLTIGTVVPSSGIVIITLPKWEQRLLGASSPGSMVDSISSSCSLSGDLTGSATCTATISSVGSGTTDLITVTGLFSAVGGLSSGKTIKITISNIRNPPTLKPYSTFKISTADSSGNLIETCSGLTLTLAAVGTLSSDSVVRIISNSVVNKAGTYMFIIVTTNPIPVGGWIRIVLPSEVSVTGTPTYLALVPALSSSPTITVSGQTITIKNIVSNYIKSADSVSFSLSSIINPNSIKPTSSFSIYTFDESDFGIDSLTTALTATASVGALTKVIVNPVDVTNVLQFAKNYTASFTLANPIDTTGGVTIAFDSSTLGYEVNTRTCTIYAYSGFGLKSTYTCRSDQSTNTIQVTGLFSAALATGTSISITIVNLYIRNPPTSRPSPAITVSTSMGGYFVDSGSAAQISHNYTLITSASVTSESYITNQEDVSYTFYINPPGFLLTTTWLIITLPNEISIYDQSDLTRNCGKKVLSGFSNSTRLDCSVSGSNLTIKGLFAKAVSDDPPNLSINIPGLRNPRSLAQSSAFVLSFSDGSASYPTFISLESSKIQMTSVSTIKQVIITRTSTINGVLANYTFSIQVQNAVQTGDYFLINSPNDGPTFSNISLCSPVGSYFTTKTVSCSFQNSQLMKITFLNKSLRNLLTSLSSSFSFLLTNVKNAPSTKPSSSFLISQYAQSGSLVQQLNSGVFIVNDEPFRITSSQFKISLDNYQVSATTKYTFTIDPTNYLQNMIIQIRFPIELVLPTNSNTIKCSSVQGTSSDLFCTLNTTNRTLTLYKAFPNQIQPSIISFSVTPIQNPPEIITTSSFEFYSYTSDFYSLDAQNASLFLNFSCQLPCKTCISTNITGCSSCYNPLTGNSEITSLPLLFDQYCYETCPVSTYQEQSTYQCKNCYSKRCKTCTGPNQRQCSSCLGNAELINGNCAYFLDANYPMPFLIAALVWMLLVFVIMISCKENQTQFIASSSAGLSIIEWIHFFFEIAVFNYYGFRENQLLSAGAILMNCIINIYFLVLFLKVFSRTLAFRDHISHFKSLTTANVIFSSFMSSRLFKFLYSKFNDKQSCSLVAIIEHNRLRKFYLSIHYLSMITSVISVGNSAYNLLLSFESGAKFTTLVDIEAILISLTIIILLAIEFLPCSKQRPKWIQNLYNEKDIPRKPRLKYIDEQYNELANASAMSLYDNEKDDLNKTAVSQRDDKKLRLEAMRALLTNLRQVQPINLEQRLQQMIEDEENEYIQKGQRNRQKERRKSDPAPFSKDNKKSHHYQSSRIQKNHEKTLNDRNNLTTEFGLLDGANQDSDSESDERKIMSYPLTPNRFKKRGEQDVQLLPELRNLTFRNQQLSPLISPKSRTKHRDQGIGMSKDLGVNSELDKLERQREEIARLNEEFKQQRLELERERAEIERLREEHSKSARGQRQDKDKLEGIYDQQDFMSQTARGENRQRNFNQTNLDAVRETETEDIAQNIHANLQKQRSRNSLTKKSRTDNSQVSPQGQKSMRSNKSDMIGKKPHRCHGQSENTRESVYNLRKKSPSRSSSLADLSPSRNKLQKMASGLSQNHQEGGTLSNRIQSNARGREITKKNGTKVYYSDKSESSIEDLMDETPTTYNLANGRLDGQSMGYRFGKNILSKGASPDKIDIFKEQQRRILEINSLESSSAKKQSPRLVKKKFRQDPDSDRDENNFTNNNSTAFYNNEGSVGGREEDITFIPKNGGRKLKRSPRDLTQYNNISNLINDRDFGVNNERDVQSMMAMLETNTTPNHHQLNYQTQNVHGFVNQGFDMRSRGGGAGAQRNHDLMSTTHKDSKASLNITQSKQFSKERIKALEVAYLTKLVPQKSTQRSSSNMLMYNSNGGGQGLTVNGSGSGAHSFVSEKLTGSIPPRMQNKTPDIGAKLTGMQILNPPQINNFQ